MNNRKVAHARQAYTFFDGLSDFGGFNDAMWLLFGTWMAIYSAHAYSVETTKDFKVRSKTFKKYAEELRERVEGTEEIFVLGPVDLRTLSKTFFTFEWFKPSFFNTFVPGFLLRKRDNWM